MRWRLLTSALVLFCGCIRNTPGVNDGTVQAFAPVYASMPNTSMIGIQQARPTVKPGKIYVYRSYIFQNELYEGVHVIDNSNPASPSKIGFIGIPFNTEMAIYRDYLYVNSVNDLVVIDIHDPQHPVEVSRTINAFPSIPQDHPPGNGYFVCPDPSKGVVVNWVLERVKTPNCRR